MTLFERISVGLGVFVGIATWLAVPGIQPRLDRKIRVIVTLVLAIAAAIGASFGAAAFAGSPVSAPSKSSSIEPIQAAPTITFTAPPEPPVHSSGALPLKPQTPAMMDPGVGGRQETRGADGPATAVPTERAAEARRPYERYLAVERQRREALALIHGSQWQRAVEAWQQFIQDYGGHDPAADHASYYNLGVAHEALRNWSNAAEAFERAKIVDAGRDARNLQRLGHCYEKLGRWEDSVVAYEKILRIDPGNAIARRSLYWARKQRPTR